MTEKTTWNYRMTKLTEGEHTVYALREVYYHGEQVHAWSEPVTLGGYESARDIVDDMELMASCFRAGVLDLNTKTTLSDFGTRSKSRLPGYQQKERN